MITVSMEVSRSRALDVSSRYSDSGVVIRMSAGSRWNFARSLCGVSPVRIAMVGVLLIPVEQVFPQDKSKGGEKAPAISEEMMKKWAEAGTPGEPHKVLDQFVGKWDVSTRMWFEGP